MSGNFRGYRYNQKRKHSDTTREGTRRALERLEAEIRAKYGTPEPIPPTPTKAS